MEDEIWVDITGFEGIYKISSFGRVRSMPRKGSRTDRILKFASNKDGYLQVALYKENIKRTEPFIHRLVALHFIENSENKPEVNHKDGNKSNNNKTNLEWATHIFNMRHALSTGLIDNRGGKHSKAKLVIDLENGIFYDNTNDAAKSKNINRSTLISKLCGELRNNTSFRYI